MAPPRGPSRVRSARAQASASGGRAAKRQPSPVPEARRASMRRARSIVPARLRQTRSRQARSVARSSGCKQNGPSARAFRSRRGRAQAGIDPVEPHQRREGRRQGRGLGACGGAATKSRISVARASGRSSGSRCPAPTATSWRWRARWGRVSAACASGPRSPSFAPLTTRAASSGCRSARANPPWRRSQPGLPACGLRAARPRRSGHGPPARGGADIRRDEGLGLPPPCLRIGVDPGDHRLPAFLFHRLRQGGEPASSTSPARPASAGIAVLAAPRQRQGDLRPHAVAGDEKGPGRALGFDAGGDVVGHGGDVCARMSASSPKPGRSMATQRRWGPRRSARGRQVRRCLRGSAGKEDGVVDHAGEIARCCAASTAACPRRLAAPRDDLSSHRRT